MLKRLSDFFSLERCKGLQILQISKNAAKCAFSRYRSCRYSRERASQTFEVLHFIFSIISLLRSRNSAGSDERSAAIAPMLDLAQLSNHLTEGSFSAVSTATIARKDAVCGIFSRSTISAFLCTAQSEKLSGCSSRMLLIVYVV